MKHPSERPRCAVIAFERDYDQHEDGDKVGRGREILDRDRHARRLQVELPHGDAAEKIVAKQRTQRPRR